MESEIIRLFNEINKSIPRHHFNNNGDNTLLIFMLFRNERKSIYMKSTTAVDNRLLTIYVV